MSCSRRPTAPAGTRGRTRSSSRWSAPRGRSSRMSSIPSSRRRSAGTRQGASRPGRRATSARDRHTAARNTRVPRLSCLPSRSLFTLHPKTYPGHFSPYTRKQKSHTPKPDPCTLSPASYARTWHDYCAGHLSPYARS
ncbi:hypothetical protein T484DRAFT_2755273 [Baffinella frigidus]|nr:hypothetical protein T484DRAFT_2755273 [Cryptophyta sp. CCMP2293]